MSVAIPLGRIDFNSIEYHPGELSEALSLFVYEGSKKGIIAIDDITIITSDPAGTQSYATVKEGLLQGNRLFDMLMYFSIPEANRPRPRGLEQGEVYEVIPDREVARCVFYLAFFLMTRANVPSGADRTVGSAVPAFLRNVLAFTESSEQIVSKIATFDLSKMDHKWIKHINWRKIGNESLNRIGLGPAGYRNLAPFKLLTPRDGLPQNLVEAVEVARSMATQPADWAIHPITRSPDFTQRYGPLNANLGNLATKVFTEDDLQRLVDQKILFKMPEDDLRNTMYLNWKRDMQFVSSDPIFKEEEST